MTALGGSSPKPHPPEQPPIEVTAGEQSRPRAGARAGDPGLSSRPAGQTAGPGRGCHHRARRSTNTTGEGPGMSPAGPLTRRGADRECPLTSRGTDPHPRRGCQPRGRDRGPRGRAVTRGPGVPSPRGRRGGPGASRGSGGGVAHPPPLPLPPPPPARAGPGRFQPVPARPPARPRARRTLTSGACWRAGGRAAAGKLPALRTCSAAASRAAPAARLRRSPARPRRGRPPPGP